MEVPRPKLLYDHPRGFVNMAASSRDGGMLLFDVYDLCKKGKKRRLESGYEGKGL